MREGSWPASGPANGPEREPGGAPAPEPAPASEPAPAPGPGGAGRTAREIAVILVAALVLSLLVKTFLAQAFFIPSGSMEQTLLVGDRVLVSKLTPKVFELHRGDVVVFSDPGGWLADEGIPAGDASGAGAVVRNAVAFVGLLPQDADQHLIKRVIGLPGDDVACCDAGGHLTVNGVAVDETPYLDPGESAQDSPCGRTFDVTVPSGSLWVMGDNRAVSADSRCHRDVNNGMVPVRDVVGKAFAVVWPFDRVGGLQVPSTVFAAVPAPATR
jgi:signal peptidase I